VTRVEDTFANGYQFAVILHKHRVIPNIHEYKDNDSCTDRNFKLLEKAFRDLNIKVEKDRMADIIIKKKGVATQFLYQMKMQLARKEIDFHNLMLRRCKNSK
jgi:hypothetical protein